MHRQMCILKYPYGGQGETTKKHQGVRGGGDERGGQHCHESARTGSQRRTTKGSLNTHTRGKH